MTRPGRASGHGRMSTPGRRSVAAPLLACAARLSVHTMLLLVAPDLVRSLAKCAWKNQRRARARKRGGSAPECTPVENRSGTFRSLLLALPCLLVAAVGGGLLLAAAKEPAAANCSRPASSACRPAAGPPGRCMSWEKGAQPAGTMPALFPVSSQVALSPSDLLDEVGVVVHPAIVHVRQLWPQVGWGGVGWGGVGWGGVGWGGGGR
jgi:hypothetical protein